MGKDPQTNPGQTLSVNGEEDLWTILILLIGLVELGGWFGNRIEINSKVYLSARDRDK
jgi:hypothetical protein